MPLNLRASKNVRNFNTSVSYRIHDRSGKFLDARNVCSIQDRLDTRFGTSRFNAISLGGKVKSLSFFLKPDGTTSLIAKKGTQLLEVSASGAHTVLKDFLSESTSHRGANGNGRHLIAIEGDGLYSYDGTTFTRLGQPAPASFSAAIAASGSLAQPIAYKVALTYYASSVGYETNKTESSTLTTSAGNQKISLSAIPTAPDNLLIDKVFIYLKRSTDPSYLFIAEIPLGTTTYDITAESSSSQTPPEANGYPNQNTPTPGEGGGKFVAFFNSKLVYAGNSVYPNEVYFSEPDLPDAFDPFDTGIVLPIPGKGNITGIAVGLFNDSVLDPFLVIFKNKSTRIYSEIGGQPKLVTLSEEIGCVSHDTITVKNGIVYFMSGDGWRVIVNGRLVVDQQGDAVTLGNGDIDDIFKSSGFVYELNRNAISGAFSVYYPTLDQYITWIAEGSNNDYSKAYVYEFATSGFKPYEFAENATCAVVGESSDGRDIVYYGTSNGYILKHSINESRSDVDLNGDEVAINAFGVMPWLPEEGDFDATYNYRELILKAINSENPLTVKTFIDYSLASPEEASFDFTSSDGGFILDQSTLDEDSLNDERSIVTARADINRVGESLAIGFYQSIIGANLGLVSLQVDSSKNGNRNLAKDAGEDGGFDADEGTYFPSVAESLQLAAQYAAQAQAAALAAANASAGNNVATGLESLTNNSANQIDAIGEDFSDFTAIVIDYYLYRRTSSGNKRMSGSIYLESIPDGATNPEKWALVETIRSEYGGDSGVSFSLTDTAPNKSVLVITLDNMAGTGHDCKFYYTITKLASTGSDYTLTNNIANVLSNIGEYLADASCVIVDYYLYRRTDTNYKTLSGKIILEGVADGLTSADKWTIFEAIRSENLGDSGVSFSLQDQGSEKSVLVATLDDMSGANHSCKFYYKTTILES